MTQVDNANLVCIYWPGDYMRCVSFPDLALIGLLLFCIGLGLFVVGYCLGVGRGRQSRVWLGMDLGEVGGDDAVQATQHARRSQATLKRGRQAD